MKTSHLDTQKESELLIKKSFYLVFPNTFLFFFMLLINVAYCRNVIGYY